jgi:hypothetical protein
MKTDSPRGPLSSPVAHQYPPEVQRVLDLTEERNRRMADAKAERKRKYGRRTQFKHMDYTVWKREFSPSAVLRFMGRLGSRVRRDDPDDFRAGEIGLTDRERRILEVMLAWHLERIPRNLSASAISNLTGIQKQHVFETLRRLGEAHIIVNLAGNSAPNLAPNPLFGFWDLRRLKDLRKSRNRLETL